MKRQRRWKISVALMILALIWVETPGVAQVGFPAYLPHIINAWTGYLPVIQNPPSPTPTQVPTATPIPTRTPTATPIPPTATQTPAASAPPYSSSYYLLTVESNKLYNLGCQFGTADKNLAGTRDQIVILDFGSPKKINSEYGTDLFWMGPVTNTQIKSAVENFGRGYYICASSDRSSQIYVAVGTTNYGTVMSSTTDARALGVAWSQMVNDINAWFITNGYSGQVHAVGAIDIEPAWGSVASGRAWVDGYDSVDLYNYYDFGTADGCSGTDITYNTCANGWTREDVWYKAYGTRPGFPIPEIYNTGGYNAKQWALLSLYSVYNKNYPIEFHAVLTQMQACQQAGADQCTGVDNSPSTGWTQLVTELKKNTRTTYYPRWSTDMIWGYTNVMPSGPLALANNSAQTNTSTSTTSLPQQIVNDTQKILAQSNLDPKIRANAEGKLVNAQRLLADRALGEKNPASKDAKQAPAAPVVGDSGFPVGIFDGPGGVIHNYEGEMFNHWQDSIGTDFVLVSAGVKADDATQGLVMVMRVSGDRLRFSRQFIVTPQKAGAVRVVSADGTNLVLETAGGVRFVFDAAANRFK